jgi:hypothetical protein
MNGVKGKTKIKTVEYSNNPYTIRLTENRHEFGKPVEKK